MAMFLAHRLDANQGLQRKVEQELLDRVEECYGKGCKVNIGVVAFTTSLNLLSNTMFSINFAYHVSYLSQEFRDIVWGMMEDAGKSNFADFFSVLRWIFPQGIRRRMKNYFDVVFDVFDEIINQRLQSKASSSGQDVLEVLLNLIKEKDNEWSCDHIKHLLLVGSTSSPVLLISHFLSSILQG